MPPNLFRAVVGLSVPFAPPGRQDLLSALEKQGVHNFYMQYFDPDTLPPWMTAEDLAYYAGEYTRTGFRGGLNWYRAIRRNTELMAPWRGAVIRQPSLFIAGERDGVLRFPASKAQIERYPSTLPGLRGCHILPGVGHWIQRERADEVNGLLVEFLRNI